MSFLNKALLSIVILLLMQVIFIQQVPESTRGNSILDKEDAGAFSFVMAQRSGIVNENCNSPNGQIEIFIKWNKHPSHTGYATRLIAGRCELPAYTKKINATTGNLRNLVFTDIKNYIINNSWKFDMLPTPPTQNITGRANFTWTP